MDDPTKFREHFDRYSDGLSDELKNLQKSEELGDYCDSQWYHQAAAEVDDFKRTLNAWRLLHPGFRYLVLLGRTSSGKSSVANCLLKQRVFEADPGEQTACIEFAAEYDTLKELETMRRTRGYEGRTDAVKYRKAENAPKQLVVVDTPGFGSEELSLIDSEEAKTLLHAMLPLIDHIAYITQPDNPLNNLDKEILEILGRHINWVPFTVVLAKMGGYRFRISAMPDRNNFKSKSYQKGKESIAKFFSMYRTKDKDQITYGKNFFVVETELPDISPDAPGEQIPRGMSLVEAPGNGAVNQEDFEFAVGIDDLRDALLGNDIEYENLGSFRRTKIAQRWSEIVANFQQHRLFFAERTAISRHVASSTAWKRQKLSSPRMRVLRTRRKKASFSCGKQNCRRRLLHLRQRSPH